MAGAYRSRKGYVEDTPIKEMTKMDTINKFAKDNDLARKFEMAIMDLNRGQGWAPFAGLEKGEVTVKVIYTGQIRFAALEKPKPKEKAKKKVTAKPKEPEPKPKPEPEKEPEPEPGSDGTTTPVLSFDDTDPAA